MTLPSLVARHRLTAPAVWRCRLAPERITFNADMELLLPQTAKDPDEPVITGNVT